MTITGALSLINGTTYNYKNGDEFQLITCSNITGKFTSITPEIPGDGLVWDVSELYSLGIIKVKNSTAINNREMANVSIFPNPAVDWLNVQFKNHNSEVTTITIYDITGKEKINTVLSGDCNNSIDIRQLSEGIYFVKILQDKQLYGFKLSVVR